MPVFTTISIIFNPNSTGDAQAQAKQLKADLATTLPDVPVKLLPTAHAGHAMELAYDAAKAAQRGTSPLIISASGDGGYNEVINGALQAQDEGAKPITAVLPSGNANDHARTMQDKPLAESIAARYKRGSVPELDVLEITLTAPGGKPAKRYAHSYIGLGLTPAVAVELNKYTLNSLKESWIVLKTFWNLRPVVVRTTDKAGTSTTHKLDSLICSTIPEMAKVLTLSKDAAADDGLFEITSLPHKQKPLLLLRLLKGVFTSLEAKSRQHDYTCTVVRAIPIQLDGEIMKLQANTELTVSLHRRLLRTII